MVVHLVVFSATYCLSLTHSFTLFHGFLQLSFSLCFNQHQRGKKKENVPADRAVATTQSGLCWHACIVRYHSTLIRRTLHEKCLFSTELFFYEYNVLYITYIYILVYKCECAHYFLLYRPQIAHTKTKTVYRSA